MEQAKERSKTVYRVQGFSCASCAQTFETNVEQLAGVEEASVNFGASKLTVYGKTTVAAIEKAGAFENLKVVPENERIVKDRTPFYKRNQFVLISSLFLFLGWLSYFILGEKELLTISLFALSMVIGGYRLFVTGFKNLLRLEFDMRTLMTIAVLGAAIIGEWGEGATVVILFAISEALEAYSMDRARRSIQSLMDIAPNEALIKRNGSELLIGVEEIVIGDVMIVKPGEKLAMDGRVLRGTSYLNEAAITGESIPIEKTVAADVFAGSLNGEGMLEVEVTKLVEDTTLAKVIHLVEEAQAERAPAQAFVDTFAKYYTPAIMLVALLVAIVPPLFFEATWEQWVYQGLAVLVVGCPCALVISTPVAIVTAIGNAAKNGVLIKGGIYLEETSALTAIAFDKTGTLTKGVPAVTTLALLQEEFSEKEIMKKAAALERNSQHPLALAIMAKADQLNINYTSVLVENFMSTTGMGIAGEIDGEQYFIGNIAFFKKKFTGNLSPEAENQLALFQKDGKTAVLIGNERETLAIIAIADEVRESSLAVVGELKKLGIKEIVMLTGDNLGTAHAIGKQAGIDKVKAELLPEDKLAYMKELRKKHTHVAMVGDGINDAPALAAATVGVAMGGAGTDTALETADIALMGDDLRKLPFVIKLSKKTLHVIKQNISFSLVIKLIALLLVIPGWLTLWIAIFADMGATLIVTLNALRLLRVKDKSPA